MQQVKYIILVMVIIAPALAIAQAPQGFGLQYTPEQYAATQRFQSASLWKEPAREKSQFLQDFKLLFSFDSRNSFILNQQAKMLGFRVGVEMFDKYRTGFGFYGLRDHIDLPQEIRRYDTLNQALRFTYSTLFFEYVIYEDFKWEASASFPFGRGKGMVDTLSSRYNIPGERVSGDVNVIAPSAGGHYKLFYWLGVGGGLGYRFVVAPERNIRRSLSSPFYVIKVKLFLGGIYKSIFKSEEVEAERAEWRNQRRERKAKREERRQNRKQ